MFLFLLVKESSMLFSLPCLVELALFQVLSVAEKLVFLKHFLSTLTPKLLSTLDVVKEEMKWQKYLLISPPLQPLLMVKKNPLCRELVLSQIPPTCLSQLEKLLFILVLHLLSTSETWATMCP